MTRPALPPFFTMLALAGGLLLGAEAGSGVWKAGVQPAALREELEMVGAHRRRTDALESWRQEARLHAVLMKRLYETKAGLLTQLAQLRAFKAFASEIDRRLPEDPVALAYVAQLRQFTPGWLGGSLIEAEARFTKALMQEGSPLSGATAGGDPTVGAGASSEILYFAAYFHLNLKPRAGAHDLGPVKRAEELLHLSERHLAGELDASRKDYLSIWIPYQLGVARLELGDEAGARSRWSAHLARLPDSYWGHYQFWALEKKNAGKHGATRAGATHAAEAARLAREQGDLAFLDRLRAEGGMKE